MKDKDGKKLWALGIGIALLLMLGVATAVYLLFNL